MFWHTKMLRLIKTVECWAWAEDANLFVGWCNTLLTLIAQTASSFSLKWCVFLSSWIDPTTESWWLTNVTQPSLSHWPKVLVHSQLLSFRMFLFFFLSFPTNKLRTTHNTARSEKKMKLLSGGIHTLAHGICSRRYSAHSWDEDIWKILLFYPL